MDASDLKVGALFTTDGTDCWRLESYYSVPSCTLVNLETTEEQNFGMGAATAEKFTPLMPKRVLPQLGGDS